MKPLFKVFFFLFIFLCSGIQSQNYHWAKTIGGKGYDAGGSIITDSLGNIYTAGFFNDTVDFDPGPNIYNLISFNTASTGGDMYILKLDSLGNFLWVKQIKVPVQYNFFLNFSKMTLDKSCNIYLTGQFIGPIDFDPGPAVASLPNNNSSPYAIYLLKLNSSGNYVWAKSIYKQACQVFSQSIAIDKYGDVLYTGMFAHHIPYPNIFPINLIDFDPGPGVFTITPNSSSNILISKFDSIGNFLWAKSFSPTSGWSAGGWGFAVASDDSANVIIAGDFTGTVDFNPGVGVFTLTSSGGSDVFITKLDPLGNFLFAKKVGGISDDHCTDMEVDLVGDILISGQFGATADFDPGINMANAVSNGQSDIFITKLTNSGNYVWNKTFGGFYGEYCAAISLDKLGNIYSTGGFSATVDFNPSSGIFNLTCNGRLDVFISKLDGAGNFIFAKSCVGIDSLSSSWGHDITISKSNNLFCSGEFNKPVDFNPDYPVNVLNSRGFREAFILKLGKCNIALVTNTAINVCYGKTVTTNVSGAFVYTWTPGAITSSIASLHPSTSTIYTVIGALAADCQQTAIVNLSVLPNPQSILSVSNTINPVPCTGIISATSTGSGPFTYSLSNGTSINMPYSGLCQGLYTLYTTDNLGCSNFNIFSVEYDYDTGLNESLKKLASINIFPNPANNKTTLESISGSYDYYIYNNLGQLLSSKTHINGNSIIDLKEFSKGIYSIEVITENNRQIKKLIVE